MDDVNCLHNPFIQTLNGGTNVIQLETAAGAAIRNFQGAVGKLWHIAVVLTGDNYIIA